VDNTNEAFVTIDQEHKVLIFNKAAEKIFGWSRDEVVGHDLNRIMAPTCSKNHSEAVAQYVATRVARRIGHETEIQATRKSGEKFPAAISFSVTEVDSRLFFTGIVRDMSETRALQERVWFSERLAGLGRLVAEITHEIKNPLMMIGGFARQLLRRAEDQEQVKKLGIIADEVARLETLLAGLRDFYAPHMGSSVPVEVNGLVKEVHDLVKDDFRKRKIDLSLDLEGDPVFVLGDAARLKQVFLNLVKNAMEAVEGGGHVSVRTTRGADRAEVVVSDDGCGIAPEDREKIFTPFFTTKPRGTGLGLCVSKRIVEEIPGGAFSVESEKGKGSAFKVSLPLTPAP
jgi:PAS domain S-box-containing protein